MSHPSGRLRPEQLQGDTVCVNAFEQANSGAEQHACERDRELVDQAGIQTPAISSQLPTGRFRLRLLPCLLEVLHVRVQPVETLVPKLLEAARPLMNRSQPAGVEPSPTEPAESLLTAHVYNSPGHCGAPATGIASLTME